MIFPQDRQRSVGHARILALTGEADQPAGQERQRAAAVRPDPADVRKPERAAGFAEDQAGDRAGRVGGVFDRAGRNALDQRAAAVRRDGVDIDHGLAAVELLVHRHESGIAQVFVLIAGEQPDAVGLERIEGVGDFLQAALRIGQRNGGEQAEAAGMIRHHAGAVFVHVARELARRLVVAEPHAGLNRGDDRGRDARLIHIVERHLHRPVRQARAAAILEQGLAVEGRKVMMMHVDARPGLRLRQRRPSLGRAEPERGDAAGEEIAPAHLSGGREHVGAAEAAAQRPADRSSHGISWGSWVFPAGRKPGAVRPRRSSAPTPHRGAQQPVASGRVFG